MERSWQGENTAARKVTPPWSWVSYVGAVASVLRTRGRQSDFTDVAGMSGYAFVVNVHERLCPSGPTAFHWPMLAEGTQALGLETEIVLAGHDETTDDEALAAELFERVREEIDDGRSCVVWGATSAPEFAVVYGYQGDCYLVRSMRSVQCGKEEDPDRPLGPAEAPEEPVRYDALQAPGCLAAVFLGDEVETHRPQAERRALVRAAELLADRHPCFEPDYRHGTAAFEAWADAVEAGRAESAGNAYNTACYCELQMLAASFCRRLAKSNARAAERLDAAAKNLALSYANLERMKKLFPFPGGGELDRPAIRVEAARLLRECGAANKEARSALESALGLL